LSGNDLSILDNKLYTTSGDMKLRVKFTQYEKANHFLTGKVEVLESVKRKALDGLKEDLCCLALGDEMADLEIETSDGEILKAHKLILAGVFRTFWVTMGVYS
jgi:hypothetical protein